MNKPLKAFITHSHKDKKKKKKLRTWLAVMERTGKLKLQDDDDISAGGKASQEDILKEVAASDILLYLVSADSLASKNCNKELTEAVSAERRVIPIILESCDWLGDRLSNFEVLPDKGKPINKWRPQSDGWQNVVDGVREVVEEMQTQAGSPSSTTADGRRAESALQQGNVLMMVGQIDRAIEIYLCAIQLNRNYAEAYNNRGVAYNQKGDYDYAIADFTKMMELKPNDPLAHRNRGAARANSGEYGLAIKDFNKAIDLNPDDARVYNMRGNAYSAIRKYEFATADHIKALELKPNDSAGYFGRGLAHFGNKDFISAVTDYSQAILLNPDIAEAYGNRGEAWLHLRDWEKARSDLMIAKAKGVDIIASLHNEYENVEDFEQKNNVKLPEDIAAMLTPSAD